MIRRRKLLFFSAAGVLVAGCGDMFGADDGDLTDDTAGNGEGETPIPRSEPAEPADMGVPDRPEDIRGTITQVDIESPPAQTGAGTPTPAGTPAATEARPSLGVILVEENPDEKSGSAKGYIRIFEDTRIFIETDDDAALATFDDLREGLVVEVWFDGPVLQSYPVQAGAEAVLIMRDED